MHGVVTTNGVNWKFFSCTPGPDSARGTFERFAQVTASLPDKGAVIFKVVVRVQDVSCGARRSHWLLSTDLICIDRRQTPCCASGTRSLTDR